MASRLATAQSTVAIWHWRPAAIATLVLAVTALTADAAPKQAQPQETTAPRAAGEPIMAIVSIKSQQAVVDKEVDHRSNMYDDAWMPHMQRITWNGIALHGGPLPGYAASHGCVRMPFNFANRLFDKTQIGMREIIAPGDPVPVDFSHPALLVPNAEAIAAAPARAETLAREAAEAAKAADEAKKSAAATARETASLVASLRKLTSLKARADAEVTAADKALAAAKTDEARQRAEERRQKAVTRAAEAGKQLDTATADAKSKPDAAAAKEA